MEINLLQFLLYLSFLIKNVHLDPNDTNNNLEKCYEHLGCFPRVEFIDVAGESMMLLPQSFEEISLSLRLFTWRNRQSPIDLQYHFEESQLNNSTYEKGLKNKFIIHGLVDSTNETDWMNQVRDNILSGVPKNWNRWIKPINVFTVDWSNGAKKVNSCQSIVNSQVVGTAIVHFIKRLEMFSALKMSDIHLIGFGLGANIAGYVGERIKAPYIGRISGIDSLGPDFYQNLTSLRLDPTDALFVDALHNYDTIGGPPVGDVDLYPNGGYHMCNESKGLFIDSNGTYDKVTNETVSCNENFAAQLMLVNSESFDCQFVGYQCSSYDKFEKGQCTVDCGDDGKKCVPFRIYSDRVFGLNLNRKTQDTFFDGKSKKYYFKTSDKFPYCLHHYGINFTLSNYSEPGLASITINLESEKGNAYGLNISDNFSNFEPGGKYTYLLTSEINLYPLKRATIKWTFPKADDYNSSKNISNPRIFILRISVKYFLKLFYRINSDLCPEHSPEFPNGSQESFVPCWYPYDPDEPLGLGLVYKPPPKSSNSEENDEDSTKKSEIEKLKNLANQQGSSRGVLFGKNRNLFTTTENPE
ncbi:pancreatic triacylglycerol lipase-like isoform X2 [Panonychus citri]|uniref:pancreatic triacylglycerol lipase-like isoform X2 n=1 Tax=Panonychus citri TaxID=50023 RepID=UPI002307A54E|nr:pancreatic triacylglycerol lipase-like isoform X2 [Panonychus citri]